MERVNVRYAAPGELPDQGPFESGSIEGNKLVFYAWDTEVGRIRSGLLDLS